MTNILNTMFIFLLTMFIGYVLKMLNIAKEAMKKSISDLIFYVTLPALLVSSFGDVKADIYYLLCIGLGIGVNLFMIFIACLVSRKKSAQLKGIYTINGAGFNMGNLAIPLLCNFFPAGIPYLCMFDVGDSFLTLGSTYAIAKLRMKETDTEKDGWKNAFLFLGKQLKYVGKSLVTSLSFDVYIIMTILSFLQIRLPGLFLSYADFLSRGNSCLAMLLIGMTLDFSMTKNQLKEALTILGQRYFCGIVAAVCIYFVIPGPLVMRQILATAVFTATPSAALVFTMKLGVRTEVAAAIAPISAVCMIFAMVTVMKILGI